MTERPIAAESDTRRIGAFELVLGGILLTAFGFVIDLVAATLPLFTVLFAAIAAAGGAVRIFAGYRRGIDPDTEE